MLKIQILLFMLIAKDFKTEFRAMNACLAFPILAGFDIFITAKRLYLKRCSLPR